MSNIKDKLSASVRQSQTGNKPVAPRTAAGSAAPSKHQAAAAPNKPDPAAPAAAKKPAAQSAPAGFSAPGRVWPD
jgi:hypothetical protein